MMGCCRDNVENSSIVLVAFMHYYGFIYAMSHAILTARGEDRQRKEKREHARCMYILLYAHVCVLDKSAGSAGAQCLFSPNKITKKKYRPQKWGGLPYKFYCCIPSYALSTVEFLIRTCIIWRLLHKKCRKYSVRNERVKLTEYDNKGLFRVKLSSRFEIMIWLSW